MTESTSSADLVWDIIFFKVEETLFARPRSEFERCSEVFADMFRLPSGNPEGRDSEHPIFLAGYKADEFNCLLKVMYPTANSLISGTDIDLRLGKEEWISVLKLSTIWNMTKIREYAIHRLSTDVAMQPIEKIQLAKAHKVAIWLEEGIANLVKGDHRLTREDLPALGYDTAALVLLIRDQSTRSLDSAPATLQFRKSSIKCANCSTSVSLLIGNHNCRNCGRVLAAEDELRYQNPGPPTAGIGASERLVYMGSIMCSQCTGYPFHGMGNTCCTACASYTSYNSNVRVTPKKTASEMIKEVFGAEIEEYRLATSVA